MQRTYWQNKRKQGELIEEEVLKMLINRRKFVSDEKAHKAEQAKHKKHFG